MGCTSRTRPAIGIGKQGGAPGGETLGDMTDTAMCHVTPDDEMRSCQRRLSGASEIVFKALDVVFAKILALLDLDKIHLLLTGIFNAMYRAGGDID
jgi:hypothetical protein